MILSSNLQKVLKVCVVIFHFFLPESIVPFLVLAFFAKLLKLLQLSIHIVLICSEHFGELDIIDETKQEIATKIINHSALMN